MDEDPFQAMRREMIEIIGLYARHAVDELGHAPLDPRILEIMGRIPRHEFVLPELRAYAYLDEPLPIGFDKTISQPFMIALMTDLLAIESDSIVLEIGTGLGYHTAILAELAAQVFSVEIVEELGVRADENLRELGCDNVEMRIGDGSRGWPEHGPFDNILIAAAPELIPPALLVQLKSGGRMVVPAGIQDAQQLMLVEKDASGSLKTAEIMPVRFGALETVN
jgi:protein-L-isoaspartate(D-aspartate) O-methyltransferase